MIKNLDVRHALQGDEWMKFQESLGKKIIRGSGEDWQVSAVLEGSTSRILGSVKRLYAPYGPHVTSEKGMKDAIAFLQTTAKTEGVSYVRIEPTQYFSHEEMIKFGCKKVPHDYQPALTSVVDLTQDIDSLIAAMDYEMRRLNRQLDQRGFTFSVSYDPKDIDDFLEMMQSTSGRSNAVLRDSDYLRKTLEVLGPSKTAGIAYAINGGQSISGVLFYDDFENKTRYYMHAGSTNAARKVGGNPAAVLYLLFNAKESGLERFDFFGVSPIEDKNHRWAGFSKFKRDFGGDDLTYSGTWELPVKTIQYAVMNLVRLLSVR